jgi:hypothetical protein
MAGYTPHLDSTSQFLARIHDLEAAAERVAASKEDRLAYRIQNAIAHTVVSGVTTYTTYTTSSNTPQHPADGPLVTANIGQSGLCLVIASAILSTAGGGYAAEANLEVDGQVQMTGLLTASGATSVSVTTGANFLCSGLAQGPHTFGLSYMSSSAGSAATFGYRVITALGL